MCVPSSASNKHIAEEGPQPRRARLRCGPGSPSPVRFTRAFLCAITTGAQSKPAGQKSGIRYPPEEARSQASQGLDCPVQRP
jgi:hypothetical protein